MNQERFLSTTPRRHRRAAAPHHSDLVKTRKGHAPPAFGTELPDRTGTNHTGSAHLCGVRSQRSRPLALATQKVVGSSPIIRLENPLRRVYVARTETAESPMCPKTLAESCDREAWSAGKE